MAREAGIEAGFEVSNFSSVSVKVASLPKLIKGALFGVGPSLWLQAENMNAKAKAAQGSRLNLLFIRWVVYCS